MSDNVLVDKSENFAILIIRMCQSVEKEQREYTLTNQVKRSGTSIGANVAEAQSAYSKADFYSKMCIALKEARETLYWLKLLFKTDYLTNEEYADLHERCEELVRILVSIVKKKDSN